MVIDLLRDFFVCNQIIAMFLSSLAFISVSLLLELTVKAATDNIGIDVDVNYQRYFQCSSLVSCWYFILCFSSLSLLTIFVFDVKISTLNTLTVLFYCVSQKAGLCYNWLKNLESNTVLLNWWFADPWGSVRTSKFAT